jgi:hypothetical protein
LAVAIGLPDLMMSVLDEYGESDGTRNTIW